jgi:hypothetical protein
VDLESFQGTIHVFRPGTRGPVIDVEKTIEGVNERLELAKEKLEKAKHAMKQGKKYSHVEDGDDDDDGDNDGE